MPSYRFNDWLWFQCVWQHPFDEMTFEWVKLRILCWTQCSIRLKHKNIPKVYYSERMFIWLLVDFNECFKNGDFCFPEMLYTFFIFVLPCQHTEIILSYFIPCLKDKNWLYFHYFIKRLRILNILKSEQMERKWIAFERVINQQTNKLSNAKQTKMMEFRCKRKPH